MNKTNEALSAEKKFRTSVEEAQEYIENFDILETINNVGNDEVFTPVKVCQQMLDILPEEVWSNPNYKWLNPCDKNGVFLREIALRLDSSLSEWESDVEKRREHILQNMIFSLGLTKFTAQVSRRTVYYCSQANRKFDGQVDQDGNSINGYAIGNGEWFDKEEGNVLNPITEHTFVKGKCIYCGTAEKDKDGRPGRYSDPKQLEHYAYEFTHIKEEKIEKHLQNRFFGGKKMKFDIIIGNPPYQLTDGGGGSSSKPIYNLFVNQAISLKPKYMSMIIPSRWFSGGKGLDEFRTKMISDKHIRVLHDYLIAQDCFPSVSIEGGVCYFLWDRENEGVCKIVSHHQDGITKFSERYLSDNTDILIRDEKSLHILMKVQGKNEESFSSIVSPRNPYGVSKVSESDFVDKKNIKSELSIFGRFGNGREVKHLKLSFTVKKGKDLVNVWKVFISKADGAAGQIGNPIPARIIGKAEVGAPNIICSETFLVVGPFETENQATNVSKYMSTKFFRFMVGIRKNKNMTQDTYKYAPLLSLDQIWTDQDLYDKYELDQEDINYIEKYIKELD